MPHLLNTRLSALFAMLSRGATGLILATLLSRTALAQTLSIANLNEESISSSHVSSNADPSNFGLVGPTVVSVSPVIATTLPEAPSHHRFWDNENRVLFASVAALSAADFAVTRSILQNGGKELNPVTRIFSGNTGGLAVNFAGETAGIIGLGYIFHKTGHHTLERIAPMLNIGASAFAVVYDLNHR
jgi:hypothetical protein